MIDTLLRRSWITLIITVWVSAIVFGLYIFTLYLNAALVGALTRWNLGASELYIEESAAATGGMGLHFVGGAILLILGTIQFIERLRIRYPHVHRRIGRAYIAASLLTAGGGLVFIAIHGTIGGFVMDIGFALYGILMLVATFETLRHARGRRFENHRNWALRLYVLVIASWLYRMEYGFWFLFTQGVGSTPTLDGPFDQVMAFFFYLPNLLVVELLILARTGAAPMAVKAFTSAALIVITVAVAIMTLGLMAELWGPAIERATT